MQQKSSFNLNQTQRLITSVLLQNTAFRIQKLMDQSLKGKKNKKNQDQLKAQIPEYSMYNLVNIKKQVCPVLQLNKFTIDETIKTLEGNTRTQRLYGDQSDLAQKSLMKSSILNQKFLRKAMQKIVKQQQNKPTQDAKNIILREYLIRQFKEELQSDQISQMMIVSNKNTREAKDIIKVLLRSHIQQNLNKSFSNFKSIIANHQNHIQAIKELKAKQIQIKVGKIDQDAIQHMMPQMINKHIFNLSKNMIMACKLGNFAVPSNVGKDWPKQFIEVQMNNIAKRKINAKLLYTVQEDLLKMRKTFAIKHSQDEKCIRLKKNGFHANAVNQRKQDSQQYKQYRFGEKDNRIINRPNLLSKYQSNKQSTYNLTKIHNKSSQNYNQDKNQQRISSKDLKLASKNHYGVRPQMIFSQQQLRKQPNQPIFKRSKSKVQFQQRERQRQRQRQRERERGNVSQQNYHIPRIRQNDFDQYRLQTQEAQSIYQIRANKIIKQVDKKFRSNGNQLDYPFYIKNLYVQSQEIAKISYKLEEIDLKKLSVRLIQDRIRFQQNKVRILFNSRINQKQAVKLCKAMQIINCLGAIVQIQQTVYQQTRNKIDTSEILSVSWMLRIPVRQTVAFYLSFRNQTQTLKNYK